VPLFRLVRWIGELEAARNPFVWRQVIAEAEGFFDRKRELDMVRAFLDKRQNSQIVGPKRIGPIPATSFSKQSGRHFVRARKERARYRTLSCLATR
jgi:adenine/guanine phosphoribosyltransferase-like PRPP-binding protein